MLNFKFAVSVFVFVPLLCACTTISSITTPPNSKPSLQPITEIKLSVANDKPESKGQTYYDPNRTQTELYDTHGHESKRLGPYFVIRDFSHTGDIAFRYARIDPTLATCLNELRNQLGKPIAVNSAYRSWGYNEQLIKEGHNASRKSYHLSGKAADIYIEGISVAEFAKLAYQTCGCGTGLGIAQNWFHVDTRGRSVRPWGYSDTSSIRLSSARRVHKSLCGGGGTDFNELGQTILSTMSGALQKVKGTVERIIK